MPHSSTGYQPYELVFGCKAPTICDAWLRLADYDENYLQSKCEWVDQQHELILAVNRCALKRIKQSVEKSVSQAGGKDLRNTNRQLGIIVWSIQKVEIRFKIIIRVNCLSLNQSTRTLMSIRSNHCVGRVLCIWWTNGSYLTFRSHQGTILLHPAPDTYLPIMLRQKLLNTKVPPVTHPYGTQSKTKVDSASLTTSYEEENCSGVIGNLFNQVTEKLWR